MYLISLKALQQNCEILRDVADAASCQIVLALKAYSCWKSFPTISKYLDGCCASGVYEARLAKEHFQKHIITYSPAYTEADIDELLAFTNHLDFNSLTQWFQFREKILKHPRYLDGRLKCGLRINPEYSTGETPIYDPCSPGSRLGITAAELEGSDLLGLSGLHFHTLCEQDSPDLERTLIAVEEKFGHILSLPQFTYLNMGGGHWITKPDYDRSLLINVIRKIQRKYDLEVWLEPGEAVAIHTGVLRATVLDLFQSGPDQHAILDISATAHMPDVIEMPYRPDVFLVDNRMKNPENTFHSADKPAVSLPHETYYKAQTPKSSTGANIYRLGGPTCLAGDIVGKYQFHRSLEVGDILVFDDMAHYTMVKTTTFNGVPHPSIALLGFDGEIQTIRKFSYEDFRDRLS